MERQCNECGAVLTTVISCGDLFAQMLEWDFQDFKNLGQIHHLTVLCYYLQHPSKYSTEALTKAQKILSDIVQNNYSVNELYQKESEIFSSSKRDWKVEGTSENHGFYHPEMQWSLTASDVVKAGRENYAQFVFRWAESINNDLMKNYSNST